MNVEPQSQVSAALVIWLFNTGSVPGWWDTELKSGQ